MSTYTRRLVAALVAGGAVVAIAIASAPASAGGADHASATIIDANGDTIGFASFTEDANGVVHVNVKVDGLSPGLHGLHIHSVGDCTPFADAGGHFNPGGTSHANHAGDLPNLVVNEDGRGRLNATTEHVTLSPGATSLFDGDGSALIIHANEDDYGSVENGHSGARIACGVITN